MQHSSRPNMAVPQSGPPHSQGMQHAGSMRQVAAAPNVSFQPAGYSDMLRPRPRTDVSKHLVQLQIQMHILTTYNNEPKCTWNMPFARLEANRMDIEPPVLLRITTSLRLTTLPIRGMALLPLLPTFSPSEAPGQQVLHRKQASPPAYTGATFDPEKRCLYLLRHHRWFITAQRTVNSERVSLEPPPCQLYSDQTKTVDLKAGQRF